MDMFMLTRREEVMMFELLPYQINSSLVSKVVRWIEGVEPKSTPLPIVILRECLTFYIKKQVDHIGNQILSKLLYDWKLMAELGVLRDVYLLGSGDLLQHLLTVVFNKLDKGELWDDDFELNTQCCRCMVDELYYMMLEVNNNMK